MNSARRARWIYGRVEVRLDGIECAAVSAIDTEGRRCSVSGFIGGKEQEPENQVSGGLGAALGAADEPLQGGHNEEAGAGAGGQRIGE